MTLIDRVRGTVSKSTLGGYGEFTFTKYPGADSAFGARRFVLFLYTPILERISMATEIEWENGGTPVRRDGQLGLGEVLLEFAVVDLKLWEFLTLRAGLVLMPVGRLNVNHDAPSLEFTDRPLVTQYVIPSTWWEAGAGLTGRVPLGPVQLSYELYAVNGLTSAISAANGMRQARGSVLQDNNNDKAITGRLAGYFYAPRGRCVQTGAMRMMTNALRAGRKPCAPRRLIGAPRATRTALAEPTVTCPLRACRARASGRGDEGQRALHHLALAFGKNSCSPPIL